MLFEDIETVLDDTIEGDHVRLGLQELRREFSLAEDSGSPLSAFELFTDRLRQVRYASRLATQEDVQRDREAGKSPKVAAAGAPGVDHSSSLDPHALGHGSDGDAEKVPSSGTPKSKTVEEPTAEASPA